MSVEVGIPFATSENALTIYDCREASRYTKAVSDFHIRPLIIELTAIFYWQSRRK